MHGRCATIKRVTDRHAKLLHVGNAKCVTKNVKDQEDKLHYYVKTVIDFSYLSNRINSWVDVKLL